MAFIIPDIFTPYLQGMETARQANWQDIANYNQAQAQQLQNAFNLATFSPRADLPYTQAEMARLNQAFAEDTYDYNLQNAYQQMLQGALGTETAGLQTQLNRAQFPGAMTSAEIMSSAAGPLTQTQIGAQLSNLQAQQALNEFYNANPLARLGLTASGTPMAGTQVTTNPADLSGFGAAQTAQRQANTKAPSTTQAQPTTTTTRPTTLQSGFGGVDWYTQQAQRRQQVPILVEEDDIITLPDGTTVSRSEAMARLNELNQMLGL